MATPIGTIYTLDPGLFASEGTATAQIDRTSDGLVPLLEASLAALDIQNEYDPSTEFASTSSAGGTTCLTCAISSFPSTEDQRRHFKTDWHRLNVKRKLAGLDPITEHHFAELIENDEDRDAVGSLSGSDSTASDEDDDDGIDAYVDVEKSEGDLLQQQNSSVSSATSKTGPQFTFSDTSRDGSIHRTYSVWRCLLAPDRERAVDPPPPATCFSALHHLATTGGRWAILLLSGGHFSAAIFDVKPPPGKKTSTSGKSEKLCDGGGQINQTTKYSAAAADAALSEVSHKSFHKYVVRAKAGGKQSTKDATGKFAKSAGSRLRRHNEAALNREIIELLSIEWKSALSECSLILIAAPGSNGKILFSGDSPVLSKSDPRVRKIPFVTRRPTFSETKRVARVLLTVYDVQRSVQQEVKEENEVLLSGSSSTTNSAAAVGKESSLLSSRAAEEQARAAAALKKKKEEEEQEENERALEAAKLKKAEKRAKQKQKQKEQRQAEAAEREETAAQDVQATADDEISRAARQAAAVAAQRTAKLKSATTAGGGLNSQASGTTNTAPPIRLSSKSLASEDAATRRARFASAAEARAKALSAASSQQRLY